VLTLWFFLTPICYSEASLPASALRILSANPIFLLVRGYRAVFLENRPPDFSSLAALWIGGLTVAILGHAWFHKLRRSFADVI
jgi:lipopolysaccharide transport system permease protein